MLSGPCREFIGLQRFLALYLCVAVAVKPRCAFVSQFAQVVGFELYAVQLVIAAYLLYLLLSVFLTKWIFAEFIGGKLPEEVCFRELLAPMFLHAEVFWNGEERHDRIALQIVCLNLVKYLYRVFESLGDVGKHLVHLLLSLEPLLFRI